MTIRLFVDAAEAALLAGTDMQLPAGAARHAQVRRVQPGDALLLFDGQGNDWPAQVLAVGRSSVQVRVGTPLAVHTEMPLRVTLAVGMPANERMDTLVEKATELGAVRIQPLVTERSVLRLAGERADRKRAHWQAIAQAACEQCGRARVPVVEPVLKLGDWLGRRLGRAATAQGPAGARWLLSLQPDAQAPSALWPLWPLPAGSTLCTLNGPEGGLTPDEEAAARRHGFAPAALGPRTLRADTAPLAVLAWLSLQAGPVRNGTNGPDGSNGPDGPDGPDGPNGPASPGSPARA